MSEAVLSRKLDDNLKRLDAVLQGCPGYKARRFRLHDRREAAVLYFRNLVNTDALHRDIIAGLFEMDGNSARELEHGLGLRVGSTKQLRGLDMVVEAITAGSAVVLLDGEDLAFVCRIAKRPARTPEEPSAEKNIRGSHIGFVESLETNIALLQTAIRDSGLKQKRFQIGLRSKTDVAVLYIEGLANQEILEELCRRLKSIDTDMVTGPGFVEELTTSRPWTIFPLYAQDERLDKTASCLFEGRFVVIVDGFPQVFTVPASLVMFFQAADDYSARFIPGSFLRLLRFGAFWISVFLPALYIAILTFHYQTIPLSLLIPLAQSRARVPFPPVVEAFAMELIFELLREAGIRLPSPVAQTIGIVGGLVLGQAAVSAGVVSNIMIIVVAVTGLANFIIPNYEMSQALRLVRFPMMLLAAMFGVVGLAVGSAFLFIHLISLDSLGQPYMAPLFPLKWTDIKDSVVRLSFTAFKKRPTIMSPGQLRRFGEKTGDER